MKHTSQPPYADLHCHSTCSDGSATPQQLVQLAVQKGLKALSITDHDNIDAYTIAKPIADAANLLLISGVEFSSQLQDKSIHILGYGVDCKNAELIAFCNHHHARRIQRCRRILDKLTLHGMPLSEQDLYISDEMATNTEIVSIGRPHMAMGMLRKGYVSSIQEAFVKFLGDGKPFYLPVESVTPQETINIIHKANGVAVIAHPHLIPNSTILLELLKMPFDGIECFYGTFKPSSCARFRKIADRRNWLKTGGSDYHGSAKPHQHLGSNGVDENDFKLLQEKIRDRS